MQRRIKVALAAGAVAVAAAAAGLGTVAVGASTAEDHDVPISGSALGPASSAALADTGGGRVTGTEINDEESYYQVEVTRDDGSQVDVQLDRAFHVVGSKVDHEGGPAGDPR